ncbi:MAG: M16 family metallopeptidase [Terriglobales bacterium]
MKRGLAIVTLATLLPLGLRAQQSAVSPAFMDQPPVPGPAPFYTPPSSQVDQLPNGLRVVVVQDARFPLITVRLALRAGVSRLTPASAGLASAEADLLTAGTSSRSALEIAEQLDAMGGDLSAHVDQDFLTFNAYALSNHARDLFELLSDVVLHPSFPESEVALEKANLLQALRAHRADAGFLAAVQFNHLLFGESPYAITAPTPDSIARLSRAAFEDFHRQYFLPNNQAEVVVVGDIPAARAHNLVQQYFGDWRLGSPSPPPSPLVANPPATRIYLVERPDSDQSTILLGNLGLTRTSPGYFPFRVANEVLGGSFNSRLIADLREARGWVYGISSFNAPYRDLGAWMVSTQVRTAVTAPAVKQILAQLDKIRSGPVSAGELSQAQNYLSGIFVLGLQTQAALADAMLTPGLYGVPRDWLVSYVGNIRSVTAAAALAAAQQIIQPAHLVIVVVGDVNKIEASLANLVPGTTLPIFDATGKRVGSYPPEGPARGRGQLIGR